MKLYKYRPLSEFLFKELHYQELFFASYKELNDPLDLSARIEFSIQNEEQLEYLIYYIFKTTLCLTGGDISEHDSNNNLSLMGFNDNEELQKSFMKIIYEKITSLKTEQEFIWYEDIENILYSSSTILDIGFKINYIKFKEELKRLTEKFLENSYTTCFSEVNNDFLMWSHYASKHSGICLEFDISDSGSFPYKKAGFRTPNKEKYKERISKWTIEDSIYWNRIKKVCYQDEQPFINFFEFSPVFENEYDCDLIGLSKSWTHEFAYQLESVFATKTKPWSYEQEWRAIDINFGAYKEPEARINHYPIEVLSSIYFGIRTPEYVKQRIKKIYDNTGYEIHFFDMIPTNGRELVFTPWYSAEEE